ncbi:MAG: hypothetical protein AAGF12_02250 [Myxococcota bacterium]
MSKVQERLTALAKELSTKGDDAQRLELVQRARRFKRSWVEMAEALQYVRDSESYVRWGYESLQDYAAKELHIRAATVDKLLLSYSTVVEHAPQVLRRDGVAQTIPTVDAVDYFARALERSVANDRGVETAPEVIDELRTAVFDDTSPLPTIRRRFNPLIDPKPEGAEEVDAINRARSASRRLRQTLPQIQTLSARRVKDVSTTLEDLEGQLERLLEKAQKALEQAS